MELKVRVKYQQQKLLSDSVMSLLKQKLQCFSLFEKLVEVILLHTSVPR